MIANSGPMSLADYTHICMADNREGYYRRQAIIGGSGDFITAPEISQMFGELIGIWCVAAWRQLGAPASFTLAELGPGRGTLMRDLLRAANVDPAFLQAAELTLVETSPSLREKQRDNLSGRQPAFLERIDDLPDRPVILVANEFLDVIPARQFTRTGKGWQEIGIDVDDAGRLRKTVLPTLLDPDLLPQGAAAEPEGAVFEWAPAREALIERLARHLATHQGVALFIDYGHGRSGFGDTYQAVSRHGFADPLERPGEADLTSHVDFSRLAAVAREQGLFVPEITTQGRFLLALGLLERAGALGRTGDAEARSRLHAAVERLAGDEQMGRLFKVFAIASRQLVLPGFDAGKDA